MPFDTRTYPDWPATAHRVKEEAGWRCVRCHHPYRTGDDKRACDALCTHPFDGKERVLTVHHLDGDPYNARWWNLVALCQACHLSIQNRVKMQRPWVMAEHTPWFRPYVAAFYAHKYMNKDLTREETMARLDELLALERRAVLGAR